LVTWHWYYLHYFAFIWYHLHNFIFITWYWHCLHCPVILIHIIFTMWHWYLWHSFWIIYTESHTVLHLYWLIKLTKPGLLGETVAGKIQEGVLGRATPCGFGCHTWSYYLCALLLLHVTWYLSTVNYFSLLSDPLTHHLFDMQLSCGMGHRMLALVRVINHARHMHLHHILYCLQWSSTWLIFLWYWHLRLMWHALSWLHDVLRLTMLFYLVISSSIDFVIMLHHSYSSRTLHVHYIHVTLCMHDFLVHDLSSYYPCNCYYFQFSILPNILFLCPTYCY